ncbi:error-prone DNA polymerase [Rhodoferax sp.]|uniref:error-prone DNA polymerase n=1 Tax=Rhodoferax sp. TaxID=50421 RepID=UPI00374D34DD
MDSRTTSSATARTLPGYAELHCLSNFSFQRGASHPEELVARALELGYTALAITDECSVAGVVRAHVAARDTPLHLLIGSEFKLQDGSTLVLLARNRRGYGQLCEWITLCRAPRDADYRQDLAHWEAQASQLNDCLALLSPPRQADADAISVRAEWLQRLFPQRSWIAVALRQRMDDARWLATLQQAGQRSGLRLVAASGALMHARSRKRLHDVITAVRVGRPLTECGFALEPNAEAHLRPRVRLAGLYPVELLQESLLVAALCTFKLDELQYEYPQEVVPPGHTPASFLRLSALAGASGRYPEGVPDDVLQRLEHELALIGDLRYEKYFLTVYDIVRFARSQNILCQGRGSAANSVVCYCLRVTEVDPMRSSLLFERFISRERNEPPDIDVDFEHERREEVIQYLYTRFGRHRAALTATVVRYRSRSAIRDVGKALGLPLDMLEALAKNHVWWDAPAAMPERLREIGVDPGANGIAVLLELTHDLIDFPRHLSQHTGGFVLTGDRLTSTVPVRNAAMENRTTIEWDKDDIDALGLLKVDVLALGMLTAMHRCQNFIGQWRGYGFTREHIKDGDDATYDMCCAADTIGVFQIESRAQQSMLPRLRPRRYYDLVVQVAIVRPGPIQGGMVHPYLRRRQGLEPKTLPNEALGPALERTLGVPIFQEQVMQIAMIAAGFSAGEADELRRAMAAWKRKGGLEKFHQRIMDGMAARRYEPEFAEAIFRQMKGFGDYGFPESHAASFALLVYDSAWMKCHEPACFLAAMLNSLPMGFYGPSQLVQDAQRHGVEVRPADVAHSDWDCTLENGGPLQPHRLPQPAVRLGLRLVSGVSQKPMQRLVDARAARPFSSTEDLALRAQLDAATLNALARADALASLSGHRRQQVWDASALHATPALLRDAPVHEDQLALEAAPEAEEIVWDYAALGMTLRRHPVALLRPYLRSKRLLSAAELFALPEAATGRMVRACGIVTVRQQPGTAHGTVFVTLEDESGSVNLIVWKRLRDAQRGPLLQSRLLAVYGQWQRVGEVRHLVAQHLRDVTHLLGELDTSSRDFH